MSASGSPPVSAPGASKSKSGRSGSISQQSENSQTAADFIRDQMQLEAEAREAMPYSIDTCTYSRGPLRQSIFSCITCNPPPADLSAPYEAAAGICYACSVQCHGDHQLVEIFSKRNFTCDCGTTRMPKTSPCNLRAHAQTGKPGAVGDAAAAENLYNHNFRNRFCSCRQEYDPFSQKGIMFQCLGLGSHLEGSCGEDWYHPGCLVGLGPNWFEKENTGEAPAEATKPEAAAATGEEEEEEEEEDVPMPKGFPDEDAFETFICFKCLDAHPWAKKYAGQPGFLAAVFTEPTDQEGEAEVKAENENEDKAQAKSESESEHKAEGEAESEAEAGESKKRKADWLEPGDATKAEVDSKRAKTASIEPESAAEATEATATETPETKEATATTCKIATISPPSAPFSLFCRETFRANLCTCPACHMLSLPFPQLTAEESLYEPSLSAGSRNDGGDGGGDGHSTAGSGGSLYERGESALKNMDRVRAIEGVMAYNMMKEKLKPLFEQFAGSGKAIGADDIKDYFAKLRGDEQGMKDAQKAAAAAEGSAQGEDGRQEQDGY